MLGGHEDGSSEVIAKLIRSKRGQSWQAVGQGDFGGARHDWAYNRLVKLFPVNLYNSYGNALDAFNYVSHHRSFSTVQTAAIKYLGASIMLAVNNRLKRKYGIEDEAEELRAELQTWAQWLKENNASSLAEMEEGRATAGDEDLERKERAEGGSKATDNFIGFHSGGENPDDLDVTVYGMLAAMRDMRPHEVFTAPVVGGWFTEMEKRIGRVN